MMDYTFKGVPVSQMPTAKIHDCLREGVQIHDTHGLSDAEAVKRVIMRLEVELIVRRIKAES